MYVWVLQRILASTYVHMLLNCEQNFSFIYATPKKLIMYVLLQDLVIAKSQSNSIDYVNQWAMSTQSKPTLSNGHVKQQKPVCNGSCVSDVSGPTVQNKKNSTNGTNSERVNTKSFNCNKYSKDDISKFVLIVSV